MKYRPMDRLDPERCAALRRRFAPEILSITNYFNVSPHHVWGPERSRTYIKPRMALARELRNRGLPLELIGAVLGRDHTTVRFYLGCKSKKVSNG